MQILAVIPARSGSKSIPHKNIRRMAGKPMLAYSIGHAKASAYVSRVIVSTDSGEYADIAREYGAEVPFLRPAECATDSALDYDVFHHCLTWLKEQEGYVPELVVQLRPTYPVRDPSDIDAMIELLLEDSEADSVRSLAPATEIPYKMWKMEGREIHPVLQDIPEAYNMPRQQLPNIYYQNACIDVFRSSTILDKHSMSGGRILGYEMTESYDIDTEEEFLRAEEFLNLSSGGKRFVIDIDGVVAKLQPQLDYGLAEPDLEMVAAVNRLYDLGHYIVMFTARGYVTKKDWQEVTERQFAGWGLKYHELIFGKPNADYYVDDHLMSPKQLFKMSRRLTV